MSIRDLRNAVLAILPLVALQCFAAGEPASSSAAKPAPPASAAKEGRDYTVLERVRFYDKTGFEKPAEAFSVLVPRGWTADGGIVWKSLQACRGEMVGSRLTIRSPDGAIVFQSLPIHAWGSSADPMMRQSMQMQAQQGGCEVGPPVGAEQYLRQVMVPRELAGATVVEVRANDPVRKELERLAEDSRPKIMQYGAQRVDFAVDAVNARLRWPDGTEGIALVSVTNIQITMRNQFNGALQQLTTSNASERSWVRFPAARRAEGEMFLANLKTSYRTNPEWKAAIDAYFVRMRQAQNVQHHMRMQALAEQTAANTRAHQQRMASIQAQGAASTQAYQSRMAAMDQSMRSWETQQASQDRAHTAFVQTIRGVETWQGGDGKVELSSGYGQAWSRGDGTYILSNSPSFDPRSAFQDQQWQELQRGKP